MQQEQLRRPGRIRRAGWKSTAAGAVLALVAMLFTPAMAQAAPGDLAHGVVIVDANKNGAVDSGSAGETDKGVAGVTVTLKDGAGAVVTTKTTAADGSWSFTEAEAAAATGPFSVEIDTVGVNGNAYATYPSATPGVNDFARAGGAQKATAAIPDGGADVALNALIYPSWALDLALAGDPDGLNGTAIRTGTGPFDANDSQPGNDSGMANDRVRSSDIVSFNWSLTADSEESLGSSFADVVLEQTIVMEPGAVVNFANRPAVCDAAKSTIVAQPSGQTIQAGTTPPAGTTSVTLSCYLGAMGEDRAGIPLPTAVQPMASSQNGSTFTTTARAYAVDPTGTATAQPSDGVDSPPIEITSAPRYDVEKINGDAAGGYYGTQTINGVPTYGMYSYYTVQISTDRKVGVEAFQQPVTMEESFWAVRSVVGPNGEAVGTPITDLKWYITNCIPTPAPRSGQVADGLVYGKIGGVATAANSVRDSGSCTIGSRTGGADTGSYELSMNGIDTSGVTYPTQTQSGASLAAGPYYVASYRVQVFIPMSEIDRAQGAPDDGTGEFSIYNRVGDFDPVGTSGASNFGDGVEPGYCDAGPTSDMSTNCDLMEDGKTSNNVVGPHTKRIGPGSWGKYLSDVTNGWGSGYGYINGAASHDGSQLVQPGQAFTSIQHLVNTATPWTSAQMCDVFDNTVLKLVPLNKDVAGSNAFPDGLYSAVLRTQTGVTAPSAADQIARQGEWSVKYGHVDLTGDDPNTGVFDAANNRWEGNWTNQYQATNGAGTVCGSTAITWYDNPADVPGGIDAVNVAWAQTAPGYTINPGYTERWYLGFEQRDTYNGGLHAGESIPAGTVAVNYGAVKTSGWNSNWSAASYIPGAGNTAGPRTGETGSVQGDRWTVVRAQMRLQKRTVAGEVEGVTATGVADYGITGSAIAGKPVVWEITSTLTAIADPAAPVNNVTITDVLPEYVIFDEAATAALNPGLPAPTVTANGDGTTTLVWNLGTRTPNQDLPVIKIATTTDTLAPNNTFVVNNANITADGIVPVTAHKDDHTVKLEQSGELQLKKSVDKALDLQNDTQEYTLQLKNFGDTLAIQAPTVIDVLPYNGDATNAAGVNRSPASDLTGTNQLQAAPQAFDFNGTDPRAGTFYYTTVAPADVPQNLNADTNPAIWSTTFTPNATAFKFVAAGPLSVSTDASKSGLVIKFTTKQTDNSAGDFYSNRFTAFSDTLKNGQNYQLLTSNLVSVRVVGFTVGDLVWFDTNGDSTFTEGTDRPVEGVKVEVHNEAGDKVGEATTDADGRWSVSKLPKGKYYAVIPASEFGAGKPLAGATPAPNASANPDADENENADHHAIASGGGARSAGLLELDADDSGDTIRGLEPLNDNVKGLRMPPMTGDDFTNLTLDLAFVPAAKFTVAKELDGDGAQYQTETEFDIEVTCTFQGSNVAGYPKTVTLKGGESEELSAPLGSNCKAVETDDGGATETAIDPEDGVELTFEPEEPITITATNTFKMAEFLVKKNIYGNGAHLQTDTVFPITVDCKVGDTSFDGFPKNITLKGNLQGQETDGADNWSQKFTAPVGAQCTATETDSKGATRFEYWSKDTDTVSTPPVITLTDAEDAEFKVVVKNVFEVGAFEIVKTIDGVGSGLHEGASYTFKAECTYQNAPVSGYPMDITLTRTGSETELKSERFGDIPVGAKCVITETGIGGADGTPPPVEIVIEMSTEEKPQQSVGFLNSYSAGKIELVKTLDGDAAEDKFLLDLEYDVLVKCEVAGANDTRLETYSGTVTLKPGEQPKAVRTVDDSTDVLLPIGTRCWIADETVDQGATKATFNHDSYENGVEVEAGKKDEVQTLALSTTNTFDKASLTVSKEVVGPDMGESYSFEMACTYPVTNRDGVVEEVAYPLADEDAKFTLKGGESRTIEVLAGVKCEVVETDVPEGATVTIVDSDDSTTEGEADGVVNDLRGTENSVQVTNTLELAEITVSKKVEGPGAEGAEYSFELACIYHGTDGDVPFPLADEDAKFTLKADESRTIEVLAGVDCEVVETNVPNGAEVAYLDSDDTTDGGVSDGKISDLHGDGNTVDVTNTFEVPPVPENPIKKAMAATGGALPFTAAWLALGLLVTGAAVLIRRRSIG